MKISTQIVTPEMAKVWLENNSANRPIKNSTVDSYAEDMRASRWEINGSTIVFSQNGRLVDGQHRLTACVVSGVSFPSVIVEGIENGVELTIDGGTKRTPGDHLAFQGEANTAALAALARTAYCYDYRKGRIAGIRVSTRDVIEYINQNPGIRETASVVARLKTKKNASPALIAPGVVHFIASNRLGCPALADQYLEGIATGALLSEGDPRLAFRNRMMSKEQISQGARFWSACKTWNDWISGQRKERLFIPSEAVLIERPALSQVAAE